jgi:hypothetical protein
MSSTAARSSAESVLAVGLPLMRALSWLTVEVKTVTSEFWVAAASEKLARVPYVLMPSTSSTAATAAESLRWRRTKTCKQVPRRRALSLHGAILQPSYEVVSEVVGGAIAVIRASGDCASEHDFEVAAHARVKISGGHRFGVANPRDGAEHAESAHFDWLAAGKPCPGASGRRAIGSQSRSTTDIAPAAFSSNVGSVSVTASASAA